MKRTNVELIAKSQRFVNRIEETTNLFEVGYAKLRIFIYCQYHSDVARYCVKKKWQVKTTENGHFNADKHFGNVWIHIAMW